MTVTIGGGETPDLRLPRVQVGFEDVSHVAGRALKRTVTRLPPRVVFDPLRAELAPA